MCCPVVEACVACSVDGHLLAAVDGRVHFGCAGRVLRAEIFLRLLLRSLAAV